MNRATLIFDRTSSRAVDRAAIEKYGIPGIVLMENAARSLKEAALDLLADRGTQSILVVCGSGNNGGDGYALARHLHNAKRDVTLCPIGEPRAGTDAAINREVCKRMCMRELAADNLLARDPPRSPQLVIDALFGTGLDRPVEDEAKSVIHWMNKSRESGSLILAVDIPSGLDCDNGLELGVAVRADRTVSFLGMKQGFLNTGSSRFTGEVIVGDIGAPIELLVRYGRSL